MIEEYKKRLLDTNICANYLNALRKKEKKRSPEQKRIFANVEKIKQNTQLYISQVTVAELRFGAEKSQILQELIISIPTF
jgi:predicted nucleic acid-binding protein